MQLPSIKLSPSFRRNLAGLGVGVMLSLLTTLLVLNFSEQGFNYNGRLLFNEFIQSEDFLVLISDFRSLTHQRLQNGTYNLGTFISSAKDSTYGTNQGVRAFPYILLCSTLQKLFGNWWDRILLFLIVVLPYITFFHAASKIRYRFNLFSIIVASSFFALNSWVFIRLSTGFWQLHLAYAATPYIIAYLFQLLSGKHTRFTISDQVFVLSLSVLFWFQPHFGIIIAIFFLPMLLGVLLQLAPSARNQYIRLLFSKILKSLGIFILVNSFVFIPNVLYRTQHLVVETQFTLDSTAFNSQFSKLQNAITLYSGHLDSDSSFFCPWLALLLLLVGIVIFTQIRNKYLSRCFLVLAPILVLYLLLAKGINEPFIQLSLYIFSNKLLYYFRDPSRFYLVGVYVYSLLILLSFNKINTRNTKILITPLLLLFSIYLLSSTFWLSRQLNYYFDNTKQYQYLKSIYSNSNNKLLIGDNKLSQQLTTSQKFNSTQTNIFETVLPTVSTAYSGYPDTLYSQFAYYVLNRYAYRTTRQDLFSRLGAQTLVHTTVDCVENENDSCTSQVKFDDTKIYMPLFVIGDLKTIDIISKDVPSEMPIVLVNQPHNIEQLLKAVPNNDFSHIFINSEDQIDDALFNSFTSSNLIDITQDTNKYRTSWSSLQPYLETYLRQGLLFVSGESVISSTPDSAISINIQNVNAANQIAIRVLHHTDGGELQIRIGEEAVTIPTKSNTSYFKWITVPIDETTPQTLTIKNVSGKQIIDGIISYDDATFLKKKEYLSYLTSKPVTSIASLKSNLDKYLSSKQFISKKNNAEFIIHSRSSWTYLPVQYNSSWQTTCETEIFQANFFGMLIHRSSNCGDDFRIQYGPERSYLLGKAVSILTLVAIVVINSRRQKHIKNKT